MENLYKASGFPKSFVYFLVDKWFGQRQPTFQGHASRNAARIQPEKPPNYSADAEKLVVVLDELNVGNVNAHGYQHADQGDEVI
jgi:hypothetical protein